MNKKLLTIATILLLSLWLTALANTIFSIDDAFFAETGISSWDYSPLNFNYGGNNFDWIIFWWDKINNTGELTLWWNTINCDKQIKWLYINTARWNKIWPLDQYTLDTLSWSNTFSGYNHITMNWWFFTNCIWSGFSVNNDGIYGYINHEYNWENFELRAWIDYDFANNMWTWNFSWTLLYITWWMNTTAKWYIFDDHGGIANVFSKLDLYGNAKFTWSNIYYSWWDTYASQNVIPLNIYANKSVTYEISWDIDSTITWNLFTWQNINKNLTLSNWDWQKTIVYTITDGTYTFSETVAIILSIPDTTAPIVNLLYPINSWISMIDSMQFQRNSDDTDIDYYELHINSTNGGTNYTWTDITPNINSMIVNHMPNDNYIWYVLATDTSWNTWQSNLYYLTISWAVTWPTLLTPNDDAIVNFWTLLLSWSGTDSNSWYTRQIATNNSFTDIVAHDTITGTSINPIHNINFMTWTFYWRVIDNQSNAASIYRKFTIVTPSTWIDIEPSIFSFVSKDNADLSQSYISNHIVIEWITDNVYIPIKTQNNIWAIFVNGNMIWSNWYTKLGDDIYIELISSNMYDNQVSAILVLWTWEHELSGEYYVHTKTPTNNWIMYSWWVAYSWWVIYTGFILNYTQKLQAIMLIQSIIDMYWNNQTKLIQFFTTFQAVIQDKSDLLKSQLTNELNLQEIELINWQIASLDYLYILISDYLNNIPHGIDDIYIAPNGKQYRIVFDTERYAYTSPDFNSVKFFPTWPLFTHHIDINNPWSYRHNYHWTGSYTSNWEKITAPNDKIYYIHKEQWKRSSNQFTYAKYFDTRDEIVNYIYANNPSATWNHRLDTSFTPIEFTAPNGKQYNIFKTLSTWPNGNKYSSFGFISPKYFDSLQWAKNHIIEMNK